MPKNEEFDTEVLVIGSGPAGATAALALATYGIRVIGVNKYRSTATDPRAHIFNQRSMEILRDLGLERDAMTVATPHELMKNEIFCTSLAGEELSRFESWHTHPAVRAQHDLASPSSMVDLNQQLLEPILLTEAARRGAHLRTDTELRSLVQDGSGVTATLLDRLNHQEYRLRARYLVGADGGKSLVASEIGLPLEGQEGLATSVGITFRADLQSLMEHRAGDLYWMIQAGDGIMGFGIGGLRLARPWDRWVATWGWRSDSPHPDLATARKLVHAILGDDSIPIEIESTKIWSMNRVFATQFRKERVFAIGDAVHRHPPMHGLGSNTSMQDAYNLAWKLALVIKDEADPSLLDSFEPERQPIGQHLVDRTITNMMAFFPNVAKALGLRRGGQTQAEIDEQLELLRSPTTEGAERRRRWRDAVAGTIRTSSAIGGEFNAVYRSGAVIDDELDLSTDDPDLSIIFGLQNGRRIPHVWLTQSQRKISTLDLCGHGRFVLLTGTLGAEHWKVAAAAVSAALRTPLTVQVIGPTGDANDPYGDFSRQCLDNEAGAVLVRPDLIVAWHADTLPTDPRSQLLAALGTVTGRAVR